ncbi:hypothetical protein BT93_C2237 [Corymbia citriodora subsp. variegata]|nr:hypothetical protein BT93_C2237 [Corymbia citriodora subsp. variegata]
MKLLSLGTFDVRFVVIHGIGGIGKTTLAKSIFKCISSQFQSCSFLSNIRDNDILSLQQKLSCEILGIQYPRIIDDDEGRDMIKERLGNKEVILVLDDLDKRDQLMKLAGKSSWFGPRSRIIITTRNTYFLAPQTDTLDDDIIPLSHQDFFFYEMKEMQCHHALQLFSKHSFESDSPPQDYINISREIVETTRGLPLALEVIGSLLHSKSMRTWKDTLKKLKKVPNKDVQKKLLISYKELEYDQQQIFLDIACHCIGEERILAHYMWKACGFVPKTELNVLIHLSLIKVIEDDKLWMHDQLKDLGREIVRQECVPHPGKGSRLWCPMVALDVVQNNLGTENIVALKLTRLADEYNFTSGEFSKLPSLRFLELNGGNFVGDFKNLLSNLTWLSWHHCPSKLYATSLCLRKLAILKLSKSNITKDWNGWGACMLGRLKYLEIKGKDYLAQRNIFPTIPLSLDSIGGLKFLSVLKVEYHYGVRKLPHSIGELLGLKHLSLHECPNLRELPYSIGKLRSLVHLDLYYTGVSALPDSIGRLESLLELNLSSTKIAQLPYSIGNLRWLKVMLLCYSKIRELPKSIWTLENLENLSANSCENLEGEIPSEIAGLSQLKTLDLSWTKVSRLPMTINQLFNLKELHLGYCNRLQLLPNLPPSVTNLALSSSSLQAIPNLSNLTDISYLTISDYTCSESSIIERGRILHPNLEWLGKLHKLNCLDVAISISDLYPMDLSSLSQLWSLQITCADLRSLTRLPSSLKALTIRDVKTPIAWSLFSNLDNLSILKFSDCPLREIEFQNVLGQLVNLQRLLVSSCKSLERLSNVSSLKEHQSLWVTYCPRLIEIKSEPSSTGDCSSPERPIPDTLKLEKLCALEVYKCESLQKIPDASDASVSECPRLDGF